MSSTTSKWAVASLTMLLLAGAAAAGAVVRVEFASGDVAVAAEAETEAGAPAPASPAAGNETNETNETPPPPPPSPSNNTTTPAPVLSPHHQNVTGNANGTTFALLVTNPATTRQTVTLSASAPQLWQVTLSTTNLSLAPGESFAFTGSIRSLHDLGSSGTVVVWALGEDDADNATVLACLRGLLQTCPTNGTAPPPNGTRPPANETPPTNGTNGTRPPANETPPTNGTNGTKPPTNETPPGNDTSTGPYPASEPTLATPAPHAGAFILGVPREAERTLRPALDGV